MEGQAAFQARMVMDLGLHGAGFVEHNHRSSAVFKSPHGMERVLRRGSWSRAGICAAASHAGWGSLSFIVVPR